MTCSIDWIFLRFIFMNHCCFRFSFLGIYANLGLPWSSITFTASSHTDNHFYKYIPLHEKCPYWELFWSRFSRLRTEYGEIRSISPYSVQMREIGDQNNSEYGYYTDTIRILYGYYTKLYSMKSAFFN